LIETYCPHTWARWWAHHNGLPWERVASLVKMLDAVQCDAASAYGVETGGPPLSDMKFAEDGKNAFARCESPIEEVLLAQMPFSPPHDPRTRAVFRWTYGEDGLVGEWERLGVRLYQQRSICGFRVDWQRGLGGPVEVRR
jgi:hypothetical protein